MVSTDHGSVFHTAFTVPAGDPLPVPTVGTWSVCAAGRSGMGWRSWRIWLAVVGQMAVQDPATRREKVGRWLRGVG